MKTIKIHIADPIGQVSDPKPVAIEINKSLPSTYQIKSLHEAEAIYAFDAEAIADALFNSLPQGTRWRLVIELMKLESQNKMFKGIE